MGLVKAMSSAVSSVLSDQWKDYFYCDALPANVICTKGKKRKTSKSSNKGEDNIITDGSIIFVADGQCMLIVEQGKVVDICAEAGEYVYDKGTEPSIFSGKLSATIPAVLKNMQKRFTFGGDSAKDQRVYYFNTKELMGNKYGTPSPIPFRVVDRNAGIDVDISIRCFGEYSYRVTNPVLFYTNVCANVSNDFTREQIDSQLKSELLTALQPAFARISEQGIRYSSLPGHTREIANALNEELSESWRDRRGIEIVTVGVNSVKANEEDEAMIKRRQMSAGLKDPSLAGAQLVEAQSEAMINASKNTGGAMTGFMGMNMASQAGGMNPQTLFQMGAQQAQAQTPVTNPNAWTCPQCQTSATGKFCPECGTPKPVPAAGWTCSCGTINKGKFCSECGSKKPVGAVQYKCDKCGWEPEDPTAPPKFCPECGDPFGDEDIVK
ncbi:MAG: SPFH domain-containing protein [Bacillota bacterium]|nr:SPFH domain-containing protein [Bacillota bacterium]